MTPDLLVCNKKGEIFEIPQYGMVGYDDLTEAREPEEMDLVEVQTITPMILPERKPLGFNRVTQKIEEVRTWQGEEVFAVAAFLPPAYTMTMRAAYTEEKDAPTLPLFAYAATGWKNDSFYTAGVRVDPDIRQNPEKFNRQRIEKNAKQFNKRYKKNQLAQHLIHNCCLEYCCPAAQNWVLNRWEAPLPTSPYCNAKCIGCISHQPEGEIPPTQYRIKFVPSVEDVTQIAVEHIQSAPKPVVSFGQGCEGEPLMQADLLEAATRAIRKKTDQGVINLNTNGSLPDKIENLCKAGMDSFRISLSSAQKTYYNRYYSPQNYTYEDVMKTMETIRKYDRWLSLNYFFFPGFTDTEPEIEALFKILKAYKVDLIQMRNLNIDAPWYIRKVLEDYSENRGFGVLNWMIRVKSAFPDIRFGYFNPYLPKIKKKD